VPRLPVDGKKVIEYRHTLGGVEREALKSLATSARITSIAGEEGILESLTNLDNLVAILASFGFALELLGITDILDFDDKAKAKANEIKQKIGGNLQDAVVRNELQGRGINQILGAINQILRSEL
jgi:hypothetical protein